MTIRILEFVRHTYLKKEYFTSLTSLFLQFFLFILKLDSPLNSDSCNKAGKTTKGWFYGLKLHLIINPEGVLVKASFSSGNKDDRAHFKMMIADIHGKVFGDRGYISKELFDDLWDKGILIYLCLAIALIK